MGNCFSRGDIILDQPKKYTKIYDPMIELMPIKENQKIKSIFII